MNKTYREALYRSPESMSLLANRQVTICGAGALGANLAESLARSGIGPLVVIDFDRVEEHNLSTQPFLLDDVGAMKAETLANHLYRAVGVDVGAICKRVTIDNVRKHLLGSALVVDCFDNSESRRIVTVHCAEQNQPCLHTGLADGFAEIIWNEHYRVPSDNHDDICDYPLARNLVTLTVGIAAETVIRYLLSGERENWSLTLKDLAVRSLEF